MGQDVFLAGQAVTHAEAETEDLFVGGQTVRIESPVGGAVHAAGQTVDLLGKIGGSLYAIGQTVSLAEAVAGNATVLAQTALIGGPVTGNVRSAGADVRIDAPIGGYAIVAGQKVHLNAVVSGDVSLAAQEVTFGEAAQILGALTLYEEQVGQMAVPERVIPAARITRLEIEEWDHDEWSYAVPSWRAILARFIGGVAIVAFLAGLTAALIPERLADMRRAVLAAPFRTFGLGFLSQSALIGSVFLVAITLVGLLLVPAILLVVGFAALAGYVVAAYAFGVGLILVVGRPEPYSLAERAIAAGVGALVAALVGLVPIVGWIFVLALSITGIGALVREFLLRRTA
jgi:hypothetical protein